MGQRTTAQVLTRSGISKEYRPILDAARKAGWTVTLTNKNHVVWVSPDGEHRFTTGLTMSGRGVKATRARFRKAGLDV